MGGEGSMLHAIKSLKYNRDQLRARINRNSKKSNSNSSQHKTKVQFKQSTPEDMIIIREKIRGYKREEFKLYLISFVVMLCILGCIGYLLYNL
ncbi:hypothetical protein B7P33_03970 [Sediminicola luteus]|uniref:Uncharacterized protein n=1 Tax=Sediminicola luteus TaxID=319238 RepID=A0A2A4GDG4_9FLAO|nr:hypothetical protein B7P33_03970 [Sediminicola luteus]